LEEVSSAGELVDLNLAPSETLVEDPKWF